MIISYSNLCPTRKSKIPGRNCIVELKLSFTNFFKYFLISQAPLTNRCVLKILDKRGLRIDIKHATIECIQHCILITFCISFARLHLSFATQSKSIPSTNKPIMSKLMFFIYWLMSTITYDPFSVVVSFFQCSINRLPQSIVILFIFINCSFLKALLMTDLCFLCFFSCHSE